MVRDKNESNEEVHEDKDWSANYMKVSISRA